MFTALIILTVVCVHENTRRVVHVEARGQIWVTLLSSHFDVGPKDVTGLLGFAYQALYLAELFHLPLSAVLIYSNSTVISGFCVISTSYFDLRESQSTVIKIKCLYAT